MAIPTQLKQLCTPALIYFSISILGLILIGIQNWMHGRSDMYSAGIFSCKVPSCLLIFAVKLIYIGFWTWVLNLICKDNHKMIAWLLVLFPFIAYFVLMGGVMVYQNNEKKKTVKQDASVMQYM